MLPVPSAPIVIEILLRGPSLSRESIAEAAHGMR
jgi:hypothetical protein